MAPRTKTTPSAAPEADAVATSADQGTADASADAAAAPQAQAAENAAPDAAAPVLTTEEPQPAAEVVAEAAAVQPAAEDAPPAPGLVALLTAASRASAVAGQAAENAAIEQVLFAAFQLKQRAQQVLHDISEQTAADIQAVIDKL